MQVGSLVAVINEWLPAIAGMFCLALGAGLIGVYGFFTPHVAAEFEVGVAVVNVGAILLILVPGLVGPVVGKLVDSLPVRRILLVGTGLAMCGLILTSLAAELWIAGLCFILFSLGLSMYGPVAVNAMLVKRFPGREARALAIAALGISFATVLMPLLTSALLDRFVWRSALHGMAVGMLVLLWVVILLGVRPGPVTQVGGNETEVVFKPWSNPAFWMIGGSVAMGLCAAIVMAICYPLHFMARGFSTQQAALFISLSGVAGMVGKTTVAVLADRYREHARWLATGFLAILAVGMVVLMEVQTAAAVIPVMLLLGFASGAFLPMHSYLNSCYFEVSIIGRVTGSQMPMFLPFGVAGPPLAGYVFDVTGDYYGVFIGLACLLVCAATVAAMLPRNSQ